jgi:hypothetical protein
VCNGTENRRRGVWGKAEPIGQLFPDETAKYWDHEKNGRLGIDPDVITSGSAKDAYFHCPIDGHKWKAKIAAIGNSWRSGNSGCPACRGLIAIPAGSLASFYPSMVETYWDFGKNSGSGLDPNRLTLGSSKLAYFRCQLHDVRWSDTVRHIVRYFWSTERNGCPVCCPRHRTGL